MKEKDNEQIKKQFINDQLKWAAFLIAFSIGLIIISPIIWIWGNSDLALKFIYTGVFVYFVTCILMYFSKKIISKAYDETVKPELDKLEEIEGVSIQAPKKSSFLQRLEEAQKSQREQSKNRKG